MESMPFFRNLFSIAIVSLCFWQFNLAKSFAANEPSSKSQESLTDYFAKFEITVNEAGVAQSCKYHSSPEGTPRPTESHVKVFCNGLIGRRIAKPEMTSTKKMRTIIYKMPYPVRD